MIIHWSTNLGAFKRKHAYLGGGFALASFMIAAGALLTLDPPRGATFTFQPFGLGLTFQPEGSVLTYQPKSAKQLRSSSQE